MKYAAILLLLAGFASAQKCENHGDFDVCATRDRAVYSLNFPDHSWVSVTAENLVFYPLGQTYVFAQQPHPQESRDGSLLCIFQPASYYEQLGKVPDNWRMTTAFLYWQCVQARDREMAIQLALLDRHKDLRTRLYADYAYADREVSYLHEHFGNARFDVYTAAQYEEAYQHSRKVAR